MIEPIQYRRATGNDILTLCELGQILNAVHHEARPDIFADATPQFARDEAHWLPSLREENRAAFLAEQGRAAVGFITVQVIPLASPLLQPLVVGRIGSIGVVQRLQGQGIGRALIALAENWARENEATDMRLNVWAFNERATNLYKEFGYEIRAFEMGKPISSMTHDLQKPSTGNDRR
ncbi:GNAT family N-acetyltransferase [Burkholderia sp. WAC0059]|uniref:GNAT family N-acetyltransferase n=1 Tax=Burkholderia sp. WAC0059 TaxID=2066022 RepID=UPI000C7EE82A|nr:GNAT family N-acetyltransferase [Burkholderia sp. WAC0059]PLZ02783.1 GNAT family N-acetyltransferase [Burkholderia sp. WAC0059]